MPASCKRKKEKKIFLFKLFANNKKLSTFATRKLGIDLWCNGSTADFGSVSLGSSPGRSTNLKTKAL